MKRVLYTISTLSLAALACGGSTGAPTSPASSSPSATEDESIAAHAAAQGGLPSLGGAGNREAGAVANVGHGELALEPADPGAPVKIDGSLREWPARSAAKESIEGATEGLGLSVGLQYDTAKLYVAAEITDPTSARSKAHGAADDHVVLTLAFPSARGALKAYEVGFWAGKPGESKGAVKWVSGPSKGQAVAGARIVEDDTKDGYVFEASLPWSAFPESRTLLVGLRGALRYEDGDGSRTLGVLATGAGSSDKPTALPPLPTAAERAVTEGLLVPKNLTTTPPKFDVFANVAGDERKERVRVFGDFLTICGPGYRDGTQFFWKQIGGELVSLEARDLGGRGKDDLLVRRRTTVGATTRETFEVWSTGGTDEPSTVFTQEIEIASRDGKKSLANALRVGTKEIEVSVGKATGWDAGSFREPIADGDAGILLPWGTVKSRTYRYEKGAFVKANEVTQPGAPRASEAGPTAPLPRDLPTPPVKSSSDLSKQVLEAYYRDQKVPAGTKPRFDLEVHVDGDNRPERVLLVGRDVVVLGPGFQGGTGYARMSLTQFADDKDITELTARDLTGDGAADLVVRGVRRIDTPSEGEVAIDVLTIYQVKGGTIARVFAIETGRGVGAKRMQGLVQFVPSKSGKGFEIDVRPGMAKGWTEKTYPWPQDPPGGAVAPLLLPWGKIPNLRYAFDGAKYDAP